MHRTLYDEAERIKRTLTRIRAAAHTAPHPVDVAVHHLDGEPVPFAEAVGQAFVPAEVGLRWGPAWGTSWFRFTGEVPARMQGQEVELLVDLGFSGGGPGFQAEGLAYTPEGRIIKGVEPRTVHLPLSSCLGSDSRVDVYVEAAANPTLRGFEPTPMGSRETAPDEPLYQLRQAELVVVRPKVRALGHDVEVLLGLATSLPESDPRRHRVMADLQTMADRLDVQDIGAAAEEARRTLAPALASPASPSAHRVSAVGHAHLDSAWLWPVRETIRKCARTFANVVALADEYPELRFACSSAQQYAWMQEHYPELFERIREKVRSGQFVPAGGMWVESDTNLPGGEAMARQFVHGKRFFRENLEVECEEVWLPDSFGYTGSLPQIARLAGCRWFLSQKMSWNQTNDFPHHTFWWEGIDGTRVFTHFPPADTYSAEVTAEELVRSVASFRESGAASHSLLPFGYGDGGGGPTREMLERSRRFADLEGAPRVVVESPSDFFSVAEEEYGEAPVWVGEMYLEFHRGVYTSQVAMKQGNRRIEHLLREAELWSATAAVRRGHLYPYDELDRIWRAVLLLQFHDILPGSSIARVHKEARELYQQLADDLTVIVDAALQALAGDGDDPLTFNAGPFPVDGVPAMAGGQVASTTSRVGLEQGDDGIVLENELVRARVDVHGNLVSVWDKRADREVLAADAQGGPSVGNLLQLHPDTPNRFDAWDVDTFYRSRCRSLTEASTVKARVRDDGVAEVEVERQDGVSTYEQRISLAPGSGRVDFETRVDWQHRETLLKVAFPLAVHADRSASEVGFGHVFRPTHTNTSWDAARFEICAHRWIHVGERGYGVALVNSTTYGHDVSRSAGGDRRGTGPTTVRLSLVRGPRFPDPETDRGRQTFRYALVVNTDIADAVREGYRINLPTRRVRGSGGPVDPLVTVSEGTAVVEAVKLAEDRGGDVVVRAYESLGGQSKVRLRVAFGFEAVQACDLHENSDPETERLAPLERDPATGDVTLQMGPFQIVTLRFRKPRI